MGFETFPEFMMAESIYSQRETERSIEAIDYYNELDPDLLVLNGGFDRYDARQRRRAVITNALNFQDDSSYEIMVPSREHSWQQEELEEVFSDYPAVENIRLSENVIDSENIEFPSDEVVAAENITEEGDTILYHTSHGQAETVAELAHEEHADLRDYEVFGIKKPTQERIRQKINKFFNNL